MSNRNWTSTLKGLGPQVPLSEIEVTAEQQKFRRELDRYNWVVAQLSKDPLQPMTMYLEPLRCGEIRLPGVIEVSLVALSLHPDPLASIALADYTPPEELYLLHLICLDACRKK